MHVQILRSIPLLWSKSVVSKPATVLSTTSSDPYFRDSAVSLFTRQQMGMKYVVQTH
jgi:hypothetical protein